MILCIEVNDFLELIAPNEIFYVYHDGEFSKYTRLSVPEELKHLYATVKKLQFGYLIAIHSN